MWYFCSDKIISYSHKSIRGACDRSVEPRPIRKVCNRLPKTRSDGEGSALCSWGIDCSTHLHRRQQKFGHYATLQCTYCSWIVVTYKWRTDLVQRQAVVKATFIEHALFLTVGVGFTITRCANKQPVKRKQIRYVKINCVFFPFQRHRFVIMHIDHFWRKICILNNKKVLDCQ